ncbi:MAG: 1-acyl-sn-glycerol-3-phosphate acyltransferase, partial [Bacteroidales bacterium]|nr:1-acyl-sn-glycerol-3-phosphate acyltransferase [Bacteroidales bacterium]
ISLVVFPEGSRSFTGHMAKFKKGAFQLADELQLSVVPITIDGSFDIMPRTCKWISRHRMIMTIHDPIPPKGNGNDDVMALRDEAYEVVMSALPERYQGYVKNDDQ